MVYGPISEFGPPLMIVFELFLNDIVIRQNAFNSNIHNSLVEELHMWGKENILPK